MGVFHNGSVGRQEAADVSRGVVASATTKQACGDQRKQKVVGFGHSFGGASATPITELANRSIQGVATGERHVIVWDDEGNVFGRGSNDCGQLGLGHFDDECQHRFARIDSLAGVEVLDVHCGLGHNVLVTKDGKVFVWGRNTYGQLGNGHSGENANQHTPQQVEGVLVNHHVVGAACGAEFTVFWTRDGLVFSCGSNGIGQLGIGGNTNSSSVVHVSKLSDKHIGSVVCGGWHCVAVASDGEVFAWGSNGSGQLGASFEKTRAATPTRVEWMSNLAISRIECGVQHTMLLAEGRLHVFGANGNGQLGLGHSDSTRDVCRGSVLEFPPNQPVVEVACFYWHNMAITEAGELFAWGSNFHRQVDVDSEEDAVTAPRCVSELKGKKVRSPANGLAWKMSVVVVDD